MKITLHLLLPIAMTVSLPANLLAERDDIVELLQATNDILAAERQRIRNDFALFSKKRDQASKVKAARNWALSSFEAKERGLVQSAENLSARMNRMEAKSKKVRDYLLSLPDSPDTRGAIRSGRALNWFLDACGAVALDHEMMRERTEQEYDRIKSLGAGNPEYDNDLVWLEEYRKVVDSLGGRAVLDKFVHDRLRFTAGVTGGKAVIANGSKPTESISNRWPAIIANDSDFANLCNAFDASCKVALMDLQDGNYVSADVSNELLKFTDQITGKLHEKFVLYLASNRETALKTRQYMRAKTFVKGLRSTVYRLVEAEDIADVKATELFDGKRVEDLLVYMVRNGYRFAEADANAERAYQIVYREMVHYYDSLNILRQSLKYAEEDERRWEERADQQLAQLEHRLADDIEGVLKASKSGVTDASLLNPILEGTISWGVGEILTLLKKKLRQM